MLLTLTITLAVGCGTTNTSGKFPRYAIPERPYFESFKTSNCISDKEKRALAVYIFESGKTMTKQDCAASIWNMDQDAQHCKAGERGKP